MNQPQTDQFALPLRNNIVLAVFCFLLFGIALVGPRPLTMHEAVLPETAREMLSNGDYLVPKSGGRPWLERPPLPQWIVVGTMKLFSPFTPPNVEWVVRLPSVLLATGIVLLTASIGSTLFGRTVGFTAGLALATSFEFVSYAWLAEQDIYLCFLTTFALWLFVRVEWDQPDAPAREERHSPSLARKAQVMGFFVALGATNLAKGMFFGPAMVLIPVAGYLLLTFEWQRVRQFISPVGWILGAIVGLTWPVLVYQRHPDVIDLWLYDHVGRLNGAYTAITEPWWYYLAKLPEALLPWTPLSIVGLIALCKQVPWRAASFTVCWAVLPVFVLSFASGKHHHYLLPMLPAWALLTAFGVEHAWSWAAKLDLSRFRKPATALFAASSLAVYGLLYCHVLPESDQCLADTVFLKSVAASVDSNAPPLLNADIGSMDNFRIAFYVGQSRLIHSLDFLLDEKIVNRRVTAITRARDVDRLEVLGKVTIVCQSQHTRREIDAGDRFTLFEVEFRPNLVRRAMDETVTPMEAMGRR